MGLAIAGAFLGLIFGGLKGLIIGAALGYLAALAIPRIVVGTLNIAQQEFVETTFSVMGAVCKADNVVTRNEIDTVERIFDMLRMTGTQRDAAKEAFRRGKQPGFDLDGMVDRFRNVSRGQRTLVQLFLQLQCMAVAADGAVHDAEHAMLVRIARRLGLSETDVRRLEALLRSGGSHQTASDAGDRLEDAYDALGVTASASDADVKRAYRKLISENHPDKLAARGLPESMRAVAEERSREINKAYDRIKEARGFS
jgi:DnaJ like chaperone protein